MSRIAPPRTLSLTEELEKLEQSITLVLQEIDKNFSTTHRIITTSILPTVEEYAKHSSDVWEGSKFWKQFFEASANVSLSGYEEAAPDEDLIYSGTTSTELETLNGLEELVHSGAQEQDADEDEFSVDSPTQVTGMQTTPRLQNSTSKKPSGTAPRSPSPRKYTGHNPLAMEDVDEPSTPRPQMTLNAQSSPFEPDSAYQRSVQQMHTGNNDPLMHRVLDKNYRIQATPHTQRRRRQQQQQQQQTQQKPAASKATPTTAAKRNPWDDSPQSSPIAAAPQLRSDLFSPAKPAHNGPRTPGVSILTPARTTDRDVPTTSTGRRLFSPQDKAYSAAKARTSHVFSDDDEDDDEIDISPPKTMQFHIPQSRLMQTPAREASKKIVEDLLLTAGAEDTDEIDVFDDDLDFTEEASPSVVKRAYDVDDDTF